ncbi:hypothetical protein E1B28_005762 [Marasmius oreades]|uniref:Uricase n=1 Tax=Marasmius oreades TaxID=181124 RepID=A0A9P7S3T9_9AGAR|nr:uncharacterized protein E1B28_005762 [Marasmius oreades]KAG7094961.1 hypothetical protein E1B28_005762 [Marasmius oreades]
MSTEISFLSNARYGKDKVRVLRVVRQGSLHLIVEYNVTVLVEGDIDVSYTKADNSVVVATDSLKNITYYLAKVSPHVLIPERFALHLGVHLVSKYSHLHKAFITVEQLRWSRISVHNGSESKEHPYSFLRDGDEKRFVKVEVDASAGKNHLVGRVSAGITDLLVLKSTGSSFSNFVRDEYTTLVEVDDRIFSTSVDLNYTFAPIELPCPKRDDKLDFNIPVADGQGVGTVWDTSVPDKARKVTLEVFAQDDSASVQATLYKMATQIVQDHPGVASVSYALPNKHFIPVDMKYIQVDNLTPSNAEVFMPVSAPSGLISATISRK